MKPKLQRLETALDQLAKASLTDSQKTSTTVGHQANSVEGSQSGYQETNGQSVSFAVQTFPGRKQQAKTTPTLPKLKSPTFSNHRHAANPALAMNLLQDIQQVVAGWQNELQTIGRQIQDIYMEGPIVDGWLESHPRESTEAQGGVRPATVDRLMDYVAQELNQPEATVTLESPRTGYRLCGLDENGQLWSRPCPADQVPTISLAIARHQKLRQLLSRKQDLEVRLSQLAETLVVMHGHISMD